MLKIHDRREPARGPRPKPRAGDLFVVTKAGAQPRARPGSVPMLATASFVPSGAQFPIRRWSRFTERSSMVAHRLGARQAMEDLTLAIDNLTLRHAQQLARAGVLTLEALLDQADERLIEIGLRQEAVDAVAALRKAHALEIETAEAEIADLTSIPGVGAKTADKLAAAGIDTTEKLAAVPAAAFDGLKISRAARDAITAWRDLERGSR